jgi:hypothetical protein
MPNIDSSEYIRRLKLTTIKYANDGANPKKFRELTRFDSYDASIRAPGGVCTDACRLTVKPHNIFAAKQVAADRKPHF